MPALWRKAYKKMWNDDIVAAMELHYPPIVIELLKKEPDMYKRSKILTDARKGFYDEKKGKK